jgi:manganese/zinc/iron transport system substrate-binding protein
MKKPIRTVKRSAFQRWLMTMLFLGVAALAISACGQDGSQGSSASGKLKVTATTGMIADVVREVGGEHVDVTGLMGPGTDPHLYKASQGDIRRLDDAEIVFYNGLHLEGTMAEMMEKLSDRKPTVAVAEAIPEDRLITADQQGNAALDPHVWFDVEHWIIVAEVVRDTLIEHDEANKADYEAQAAAYIEELEELDRYAAERMAEIPEEGRVLVTAHDAFGYFGKAYGIEVMGLQGISTASEYGSKDVSGLRDYLVENKIKAVFIESSVPKRSIEAVIEGASKLGHEVTIGGELFSDAMGEDGTPEGTYIGMVRHNVDTIANALK